jgi:hypothetical protein
LISLNFSQEFSEAVFLGIHVESQLGEEEVLSLQTRVPVRLGHNFGSDHWISLKSLQEFPDTVFLGVDVESLIGERGLVARDQSTGSKVS